LLGNGGGGVPGNAASARRLVTLCGCHGVGKSTVAAAVARGLMGRQTGDVPQDLSSGSVGFTSMLVECRGCDGTFGSLTSRILAVFGLRHRQPHDTGFFDVIARGSYIAP